MSFNRLYLGVGGVALVALAIGGYYWPLARPGGSAPDFSVAATPLGITFQPLGAPQGYSSFGYRFSHPPRNEIVYSNENGLTLYTYDKDERDRSNCLGDCAKTWIPASPLPGARAVSGWAIIRRQDGSRQWALKGKPLYTFVKDKEGGDVGGSPSDLGAAGGGSKLLSALKGKPLYTTAKDQKAEAGTSDGDLVSRNVPLTVPLPGGWHIASFKTAGAPTAGMTPPRGIRLEEVTDANGVILVDNRGMTIYAFDGDVGDDTATCGAVGAGCKDQFVPLSAPGLAHPTGDWSVIDRKDGVEQWAYKGKALYTFKGDQVIGDVNGGDVDKRWHVAVIQAEFLPSNVKISHHPGRGVMLTTPAGMTLYRREAKAWLAGDVYVAGSAFQLHDFPYRPKVGRSIRPGECRDDCLKIWLPYAAPADAQPRGNWGIYTRPDGTRQWTYKDYALYTYAGDKQPGDMTGDDIYDIALSDNPNQVNDVGYPEDDVAALYWMHVPL